MPCLRKSAITWQGATFADRLLWVDVKKDGRTVYTGIFSHWVAHQSEGIGAGK